MKNLKKLLQSFFKSLFIGPMMFLLFGIPLVFLFNWLITGNESFEFQSVFERAIIPSIFLSTIYFYLHEPF